MKLMIISDIHGSYNDLCRVIEIYNEEQCDKLVILGDILYHGPRNDLPEGYNPKACIQLLNEYKDKIMAVRGNCDAEVDQMVLNFPIRADYAQMYIDNHLFFFTHGHIYDEEHMPLLNEGNIFVYGHYHKPVAYQKDGIYRLNPNSISLPKENVKSYGIYNENRFTIYSLDKKEIKYIDIL